MSHMVDIFPSITRMDSNDFGIRCSLKLLGSRRPDEDLRRRKESRYIYEVAESRNLGNSLDGAFSKDGKETWFGTWS